VTISPFHSDRLLCCMPALAGVLVFALAALDPKATLHDKWHIFLFALAPAIAPRSLRFVDEAGAPVRAEVRVGAAVDVVAQAGRPKTITGFQTLTTPVLLGPKDRAELAGDEWLPLSAVLEGVVVLRPNPAAAAKKKDEADREAKKLKLGAPAARARADLAWG
jgi:26S proteasome regulatory subunit N1